MRLPLVGPGMRCRVRAAPKLSKLRRLGAPPVGRSREAVQGVGSTEVVEVEKAGCASRWSVAGCGRRSRAQSRIAGDHRVGVVLALGEKTVQTEGTGYSTPA